MQHSDPTLSRRAFTVSASAAAAAAGLVALGLRAAPARATATTDLNLTITHYPDQDYALPVVVAQDQGYLAKAGMQVKSIVGSAGGGTTVRNVVNGGLIMGEVSTAAAIKAILAGESLKIFASGVQSPGTICWVSKPGSPIKTIHDLAGKTVGYTSPGSVSEVLLQMSLQKAGVDPASVKTKAAGGIGENLTLLQTGGVDAAFTVDPVLDEHKKDLQVIFFARQYVPRYLQTVWVADPKVLQSQGKLVAAFIQARAEGLKYTIAHPREAVTIWSRVTHVPEGPERTTLLAENPADYFSNGALDGAQLALVVTGMRIGRLIGSEKVQLASMVDESALPPNERGSIPAEA